MYIYSTNVNMYMCVLFYFLDLHKRKIPKPQDPEGAWPTSMPWSWAAMRSFSLMDLCWVSVSWWDRDTFSSFRCSRRPAWLICPTFREKQQKVSGIWCTRNFGRYERKSQDYSVYKPPGHHLGSPARCQYPPQLTLPWAAAPSTAPTIHICNGILAIKKEQNNAICSNMDGPRDCHTE